MDVPAPLSTTDTYAHQVHHRNSLKATTLQQSCIHKVFTQSSTTVDTPSGRINQIQARDRNTPHCVVYGRMMQWVAGHQSLTAREGCAKDLERHSDRASTMPSSTGRHVAESSSGRRGRSESKRRVLLGGTYQVSGGRHFRASSSGALQGSERICRHPRSSLRVRVDVADEAPFFRQKRRLLSLDGALASQAVRFPLRRLALAETSDRWESAAAASVCPVAGVTSGPNPHLAESAAPELPARPATMSAMAAQPSPYASSMVRQSAA
jgi:hypothetical protein